MMLRLSTITLFFKLSTKVGTTNGSNLKTNQSTKRNLNYQFGQTQHRKLQWIQSRCAIHPPERDLCLLPLGEQHRPDCSSSAV